MVFSQTLMYFRERVELQHSFDYKSCIFRISTNLPFQRYAIFYWEVGG